MVVQISCRLKQMVVIFGRHGSWSSGADEESDWDVEEPDEEDGTYLSAAL